MGTADYDLYPGQMVGEYRIERKIGEGGFGKVYAAVHPVIGKAAAVKILNPDLAKNEEMVSRFVSEARAVNQIRHRHIIDIFAFGTLPGNLHYFVMELLEGSTLDAYMKKQGPLSPEVALAILWPIGRALVAAHKAGITHRDLKPENVFLTFDQDGGIFPKLLDFGIAKLLHESEIAHRTRTGAMLGTPIYMSPEQCRGGQIDQRSDIYSFGIMVHEVLTGRRPFSGETLMDLLMKQIAEPPPPMSSQRTGLPRSLDAAVLHMLEKMPERRPDTMQAALDELAAGARSAGIPVPGQAATVPQPGSAAGPASPGGTPHLDTGAWLHQSGTPLATPTGPGMSVAAEGPQRTSGPGASPSGQQGQSPVQAQSAQYTHSPVQAQSAQQGQSQVQAQSVQYGQSPAAGQGGYPGASAAHAQSHAATPNNLAPPQGWGGAPGYGGGAPGYPPAAGGPTLQSAGALPAKKPSSATGIVAAIVGGLFFVFVLLSVGFCAIVSSGNSVEIGSAGPTVSQALPRESTADLNMRFSAPGTPQAGVNSLLHSHRQYTVKVLAVGAQRALRAEVHYADAVVQSSQGNSLPQTETSPVVGRTFVVSNNGGTLDVSPTDGLALGPKERSEILVDVGALFKPRPPMFDKELHVGDALTPPSQVVVDLLGLEATEDGATVRADNASFKLQSIDSSAGTATFEVNFLYVYDARSPSLRVSVPLTGTITFDSHTGLAVRGSLNGPVDGAFVDQSGNRLGVTGTLTMESR